MFLLFDYFLSIFFTFEQIVRNLTMKYILDYKSYFCSFVQLVLEA